MSFDYCPGSGSKDNYFFKNYLVFLVYFFWRIYVLFNNFNFFKACYANERHITNNASSVGTSTCDHYSSIKLNITNKNLYNIKISSK